MESSESETTNLRTLINKLKIPGTIQGIEIIDSSWGPKVAIIINKVVLYGLRLVFQISEAGLAGIKLGDFMDPKDAVSKLRTLLSEAEDPFLFLLEQFELDVDTLFYEIKLEPRHSRKYRRTTSCSRVSG